MNSHSTGSVKGAINVFIIDSISSFSFFSFYDDFKDAGKWQQASINVSIFNIMDHLHSPHTQGAWPVVMVRLSKKKQ